jgi:hypothetical protein
MKQLTSHIPPPFPCPPSRAQKVFRYVTDVTLATVGMLGARGLISNARGAEAEEHLW